MKNGPLRIRERERKVAASVRVYSLNISDAEPSPEKQSGWGFDLVRADKDKQMRKNVALAKIHR